MDAATPSPLSATRSIRRRTARAAGTLLIIGGLALLSWTFVVWQWNDPFTSLYTRWEQRNTMRPGDRITLKMPYGTFEYAVTGHTIVDASDLSVLKSRGREQIALQACHPRFFATQRYIVWAKPVRVTPNGGQPYRPVARTSLSD